MGLAHDVRAELHSCTWIELRPVSTRHSVDEEVPSFFATTATDTRGNVGNSALSSSTWALEGAVKTCPRAIVLVIFRASQIETLTAHSSYNCPHLRENATTHQEGPKIAKSFSKES